MPKYIDVEAFVKEKREWYCAQCEKRKSMKRGRLQFVYEIGDAPCRACYIDDMISDIEDLPAADVEPVGRGRWIPINRINPAWGQFGIAQHKCSVCGSEEVIARKRCPKRGAKMGEEEEDGTL